MDYWELARGIVALALLIALVGIPLCIIYDQPEK